MLTCYTRDMKLFMFKGGRARDIIGHTLDPSGADLPVRYGPWALMGPLIATRGGLDSLAPADTPVGQAIRKNGYFLSDEFGRPLEGDR